MRQEEWAEQVARQQVVAEELKALAIAEEPEALDRADELMASFEAEFARDTAEYRFECRRWGDFLSLFIARPVYSWRSEVPTVETYATAVNLRETREIKLLCGRAPDRDGELEYMANWTSDNRDAVATGTGCGTSPAPKGYHYVVSPEYPRIPGRSLFSLDVRADRDCGMVMHHHEEKPRHRTPNYPRPAEDDRIRFEGIDATVYAPAGRGQEIHETILQEIGDYSESLPA